MSCCLFRKELASAHQHLSLRTRDHGDFISAVPRFDEKDFEIGHPINLDAVLPFSLDPVFQIRSRMYANLKLFGWTTHAHVVPLARNVPCDQLPARRPEAPVPECLTGNVEAGAKSKNCLHGAKCRN